MFDIMYVLSRPYFEQQLELVDISIASLKELVLSLLHCLVL